MKIIVDSTAYLPSEIIKKLNITVLPLTVTINGKEFIDNDQSKYEEFYSLCEKGFEPKSSQPSVGLVYDTFQKIIDAGDDALVLTLSASLSGTNQTFNMVKNDIDKNDQISVVDSGATAQSIYLYVLEVEEMLAQNKSRKEICERIEILKKTSLMAFIPDDFNALQRGGRISLLGAKFANFLRIKAILKFQNGILTCSKKTIGMFMAINDLLISIPNNVKRICLMQISKSKYYQKLKECILKRFDQSVVYEGDVGMAIGTHVGPAIGISAICE